MEDRGDSKTVLAPGNKDEVRDERNVEGGGKGNFDKKDKDEACKDKGVTTPSTGGAKDGLEVVISPW